MQEKCWFWAGRLSTNGYGDIDIKVDGKWRTRKAHRAIYEALVGEVPEGLVLDHLCRNRNCINPEHLEPVTHQENILRGVGTGAQNAKKTGCYKGHPYTPENTIRRKGFNYRECRTCHNENQARYRERLHTHNNLERRTEGTRDGLH